MSILSSRRRTPPTVVWAASLAILMIIAACAALAVGLWSKMGQVEALETQVTALQGERQALESSLGSLQETAAATEKRLAALEANDPAQQLAALQQAVDSATGSQKVDELRASFAGIQAQVDGFQSDLDGLASRLDSLQAGNSGASSSEVRIQVTPQKQGHNLSCESSAASMAARYQGVDLSEAAALAALPLNDNPNLGFRGNVDGPTGGIEDYGVYAGPVIAVLDANGLHATLVSGGLDGVRAAIARGNPVIAWVTYRLLPSTPVLETIGGQQVTLVPNQHVVVVTGYDSAGFWANDPWEGGESYYTAADLARAMGYFGNMAVEVAGP
jgi:uncharacterized protein YvpB